MIVNSLITGITKYFSSLSVPSLYGTKKVSLFLADDRKVLTGESLEIDATESIALNISLTPMQHQAESQQVFIDGSVKQPNKMVIVGHMDSKKLINIQNYANVDQWMYVLHSKYMGGTIPHVTYMGGSRLYTITNLDIQDEGFVNTCRVQITLTEAVTYEYGLTYKAGEVKQTNSISGDGKSDKKGEIRYDKQFESGSDVFTKAVSGAIKWIGGG